MGGETCFPKNGECTILATWSEDSCFSSVKCSFIYFEVEAFLLFPIVRKMHLFFKIKPPSEFDYK